MSNKKYEILGDFSSFPLRKGGSWWVLTQYSTHQYGSFLKEISLAQWIFPFLLMLWMVSDTRRTGSCGKAFDILKVEVNVSPDFLVFKRFRENFSKIALGTVPNKLFGNSIKPEYQKFFSTQKDLVIKTLKEAPKNGT